MRQFFSELFRIGGTLIMVLSGTCSLAVLVPGAPIAIGAGSTAVFNGIGMVAVCGGIPFLFGLALFGIGKLLKAGDDKKKKRIETEKRFFVPIDEPSGLADKDNKKGIP
ncbi:MAG: hypothetical protein GC185_02540 [Alphaproteobacteria bacterium]|nr:hypothetical protein [Alphaproteobacteria bacterium]